MIFDHLKSLAMQDMAWMELPEVAPEAQLQLCPATEVNSRYFNAMLKRAGRRIRQMAKTDKISAADAEANRNDDRALFPLYVLVGWTGIEDDDGAEVPFSPEAAAEFCDQIPGYIFDRIRNFAATPERFVPDGEELPDPEAIAKN